jgi:hypothetical protein
MAVALSFRISTVEMLVRLNLLKVKGNDMNLSVKAARVLTVWLVCAIVVQTAYVSQASSQNQRAQDAEVIVAEGTPLNLVMAQEVSSKTAKPGDPISFKVDEDVTVNGRVVVSKGTPATGSVINAEKSGRMGKAGKLGIQVESTKTVDGQPLRLRAAKGKEGDDKTNSVVTLSILVSSLFMLKKGEDAKIKEGTKVQVYVGEEKRFRVTDGGLVAERAAGFPQPNATGEMVTGSTSADTPVTVYIYRPGKLVGKALEPSVFCDGVELARMDNGRFVTLRLTPGKHIIHMTDKKKGFELDMGPGQEYYFRVGIEMGMWKGQGKLMLEEKEKGEAEIKKLKPLDSSKIKNHTLVVVNKTDQP